jgi:hypothetical protein
LQRPTRWISAVSRSEVYHGPQHAHKKNEAGDRIPEGREIDLTTGEQQEDSALVRNGEIAGQRQRVEGKGSLDHQQRTGISFSGIALSEKAEKRLINKAVPPEPGSWHPLG